MIGSFFIAQGTFQVEFRLVSYSEYHRNPPEKMRDVEHLI